MTDYIITQEQLNQFFTLSTEDWVAIHYEEIVSHPLSAELQKERERVLDKLDEKIIVEIDCHDCRMTLIKFVNDMRGEP